MSICNFSKICGRPFGMGSENSDTCGLRTRGEGEIVKICWTSFMDGPLKNGSPKLVAGLLDAKQYNTVNLKLET